jgi:hypothetical protein
MAQELCLIWQEDQWRSASGVGGAWAEYNVKRLSPEMCFRKDAPGFNIFLVCLVCTTHRLPNFYTHLI